MKSAFALLFLFLGLVFSQEAEPVGDNEIFVGAEEVEQTQAMPVEQDEEMMGGMDETPLEGVVDERADHRCGSSYKETSYTTTFKGNGPCYGGDSNGGKRLKATSPNDCAKQCVSKYKSTYVEYSSSRKECDCQKGNKCGICTRCGGGFKAYKVGTSSKAGTCGGSRCCSRWGWCGGNKNAYTTTSSNSVTGARNGVCTNGDSKRFTGVTSAQSCADKCLALKPATKFIEFASSIKTCDCDKGTKCTINRSHSYHRKFTVYDIKKVTKKVRKYDAWCTKSNSILNHLWGTAAYSEDVSVTVTSAVAGVLGLIGLGSFKIIQHVRGARGSEYDSLLDV